MMLDLKQFYAMAEQETQNEEVLSYGRKYRMQTLFLDVIFRWKNLRGEDEYTIEDYERVLDHILELTEGMKEGRKQDMFEAAKQIRSSRTKRVL